MNKSEKINIGLAAVGLLFTACSCVAAWVVVPSAFSSFFPPRTSEVQQPGATPTIANNSDNPNSSATTSTATQRLISTVQPSEMPQSETTSTTTNTPTAAQQTSPTVRPSQTPRPTEQFTSWQGEYFSNRDFRPPATYSRTDAEITFDWGDTNPAPSVPLDDFSIRWIKCAEFEERYYLFKATVGSSDSLAVYFDDVEVLKVSNSNPIEQKFYAPAGQHCVKVEYIDYAYQAYVSLEISPTQ